MAEELGKNFQYGMLDDEFLCVVKEYFADNNAGKGDKLHDRDGKFMYVWNYDNIPIPVMGCVWKSIPILPNFEVRDDDICICAFPSSGTHWFWEIICMLLNGKAMYLTGTKEQDMMEFLMPEVFEKRQSPRILNTHLRPKYLPEKMVKEGKIILVVRNPKDVIVSNYRQTYGLKVLGYEGSFPSFFESFLEGKVHYGNWFDYINDWMEAKKNNPNIMLITYEEAKKDLPATVECLSKYLNLEQNEELIKKIAELCTFKSMKTAKEVLTKDIDMWREGYSFYRSGKAGTWKDWLTVQQNEKIEECMKTKLNSLEIAKMYMTS